MLGNFSKLRRRHAVHETEVEQPDEERVRSVRWSSQRVSVPRFSASPRLTDIAGARRRRRRSSHVFELDLEK
jgi:hypothetical protein